MMINTEIKEFNFHKKPEIGTSFTPGVEPGVVISPPIWKSDVIPGYRVRFKGIGFILGISCEADLQDDCSAYPYSEDYKNRPVYIRYIQTSDKKFRTPEGSRIGNRWDHTLQKIGGDKFIYSGNDSCVRLKSGWNACIDLMSTHRQFDTKARRLMPKKNALIDFYYKGQSED